MFAPFYPDPSKRVLAVDLPGCGSTFVMKTEVLLGLARDRGGEFLEWEQWNAHRIEVQVGDVVTLWVSGPRLFCIPLDVADVEETRMDVYDFSAQASARYLKLTTDGGGAGRRFMRPSVRGPPLPQDVFEVYFADGGHDSIVLLAVNTPRSLNLTRI